MAMLLARARLLARTAPQRMLSMRRSGRNMCTAAAEKDPTELGLNIRNPEVQLVAAAILGLYAGATRWTIKDKQLAKQEAALKEAYEARHPEAPPVEAAVSAEPPSDPSPTPSSTPSSPAPEVASPVDILSWRVGDVVNWVKSLELDVHADEFAKHSVDGKLLLTLDEQELYNVLNIISPLHRKKLLIAIDDLRAQYLNP